MLNINPINFNNGNYHITKPSKKVMPVNSVKKTSNSSNNNSDSGFSRNLEDEIQKIKVKNKKKNK